MMEDNNSTFGRTRDLDPRSIRTLNKLRTALIKLLHTKQLEEISISELTKVSGINRSTFYLHYVNVAELFREIEEEMLDEFSKKITSNFEKQSEAMKKGATHRQLSERILTQTFQFLKKHSDFAPILLTRSSGRRMLNLMLGLGQDIFRADWAQLGFEIDNVNGEYFYTFISNGIVGLQNAWFENGMKESPEAMAKLAYNFMNLQPE